MKKILFTLLFAAISSAYANESTKNINENKVIREASFFSNLNLVADENKFEQDWKNSATKFQTIKKRKAGESFTAFVTFGNCELINKFCDVRASYNLISPSGQIVESALNVPIYLRQSHNKVFIGAGAFKNTFESKDEKGTYILEVRVSDRTSGAENLMKQSIELID